jgi:hypothetical protein
MFADSLRLVCGPSIQSVEALRDSAHEPEALQKRRSTLACLRLYLFGKALKPYYDPSESAAEKFRPQLAFERPLTCPFFRVKPLGRLHCFK